ncbi:hypothetical protein L6164_001737 [Bauhinia variegata]|uniref:Uncharacterized protein n=1 Tax=Bauhinia variegata TaxID=167791 RepID=A0ACB9QAP6_BAUVA|nr:hypothetical protein L6164_001737 [Bauhinia variegata]
MGWQKRLRLEPLISKSFVIYKHAAANQETCRKSVSFNFFYSVSLSLSLRPEGNPLDLNNLPDDYSRDHGKQALEDNSSSGCRKKKSGGKDGKDECGKVYECRFCSLKFCKSQALGGHMNRHQRETETLNHARQLVFRNDHNLAAAQGAPHLGYCQPLAPGNFNPAAANIGDPTIPLRFPRYFSGSSSTHLTPPPPPPQPSQQYLYSAPSRHTVSFPSHYPAVNDYYVGHVLGSSTAQPYGHSHHHNLNYVSGAAAESSGYNCIVAPPVGQGFASAGRGSDVAGGGKDVSLHNAAQQRLDPASAINRYQDGF